MWKQIGEFFKHVLFLTQETQKNQEDIRRLTQEMQDLTRAVERLAYEIHRVSERESHERELMALRLENERLRFEGRLLAGKPDKDRDKS
jgi:predicted  nucleic acid-binding Zn-ribbon protein